MDYKIVIPSFKRHDIICSRTIGLLIDYKIPMDKVYVFVVEEEFNKYKSVLPNLCNIVIGVKGVARQRDFIGSYFEDGQPLLSLDDDIVSLDQLDTENTTKTKPIKCLDTLIYETFYKLDTHELNLAGLYPVNNYYFLKEKDTTDLRFIIGQVKIYYNKKHLTLSGGIEDRTIEKKKEEVERFKKKYDNYCDIKCKDNGDMNVRLFKNPTPIELTALWVGKTINSLVELSWLSWLKQGYRVNIYNVNIIKADLPKSLRKFFNNKLFFKNALKIMPFDSGEEILPLSDLWRYKFLYQKGGIWMDSDMILLDQLPNQEFIITTEHTFQAGAFRSKLLYKPNIGILKFAKGNKLLEEVIDKIEKTNLVAKSQYCDNMKIFQRLLLKHDYKDYYIEPNMTCGVPWWNMKELYEDIDDYTLKYKVEVKNKNWLLTNAFALHCWGNFSRGNKIDIDNCSMNSIFKTIHSHYRCNHIS